MCNVRKGGLVSASRILRSIITTTSQLAMVGSIATSVGAQTPHLHYFTNKNNAKLSEAADWSGYDKQGNVMPDPSAPGEMNNVYLGGDHDLVFDEDHSMVSLDILQHDNKTLSIQGVQFFYDITSTDGTAVGPDGSDARAAALAAVGGDADAKAKIKFDLPPGRQGQGSGVGLNAHASADYTAISEVDFNNQDSFFVFEKIFPWLGDGAVDFAADIKSRGGANGAVALAAAQVNFSGAWGVGNERVASLLVVDIDRLEEGNSVAIFSEDLLLSKGLYLGEYASLVLKDGVTFEAPEVRSESGFNGSSGLGLAGTMVVEGDNVIQAHFGNPLKQFVVKGDVTINSNADNASFATRNISFDTNASTLEVNANIFADGSNIGSAVNSVNGGQGVIKFMVDNKTVTVSSKVAGSVSQLGTVDFNNTDTTLMIQGLGTYEGVVKSTGGDKGKLYAKFARATLDVEFDDTDPIEDVELYVAELTFNQDLHITGNLTLKGESKVIFADTVNTVDVGGQIIMDGSNTDHVHPATITANGDLVL